MSNLKGMSTASLISPFLLRSIHQSISFLSFASLNEKIFKVMTSIHVGKQLREKRICTMRLCDYVSN